MSKIFKEARVIIPEYLNDDIVMCDLLDDFEEDLSKYFMYFTITPVEAMYPTKNGLVCKESLAYDVVLSDSLREFKQLKKIAKMYGELMDLSFIYIRNLNKEISLIPLKEVSNTNNLTTKGLF